MKTKVCGMRNSQNIKEIVECQPDFIGFIFYEKSPRYAGELDEETLKNIPQKIKKIGVFVDENIEKIVNIAAHYQLDGIQLHGNETPEMCRKIKAGQLLCIKTFGIEQTNDFDKTTEYESITDYFLFDTKTLVYGGSGKKFDWSLLNRYQGKTPFFLSGGISVEDGEWIKQLTHNQLFGIDINSRFEIEAGTKDVDLVKRFIDSMRN